MQPPLPLPRSCLAGAISEEVVQDLLVLLSSVGREAGQRFEAGFRVQEAAGEDADSGGADPMDIDGAAAVGSGEKGAQPPSLQKPPLPPPLPPLLPPPLPPSQQQDEGAGATAAEKAGSGPGARGSDRAGPGTATSDDLLCEEEEGTFDHDSPGRLGAALPPGRLTADQPSAKFAAQEGAILAEFDSYLRTLLKIGSEAKNGTDGAPDPANGAPLIPASKTAGGGLQKT